MKYPTHLENHIKDYQKTDFETFSICSSTGSEKLEIWYYGDIFEKYHLIVDTENTPCKIIAKAENGEEFLVFDNSIHGYNAMFCDEFDEEILNNRPLQKLEIEAEKIIAEFGYSIDYEDEKEDYDIDENGNVELINGKKMTWEDVKRNGMDFIMLSYIDKNGQKKTFLEYELA